MTNKKHMMQQHLQEIGGILWWQTVLCFEIANLLQLPNVLRNIWQHKNMETPEDKSKDANVKSKIDAITGLVKAVPIYNDAIQPAAKEIGKSLATVTKTINIAWAPIGA